jgi:hypothetical protein
LWEKLQLVQAGVIMSVRGEMMSLRADMPAKSDEDHALA